jgi:glutathione peroxidase
MIPNRFRRRLALGAALWVAAAATHAQSRAACPTLLNHRAPRLQDEAVQDLCQYAGQVLLVVNTASFCGFTPQYEAMEALFGRYAQRGFQVLGFPSNDFRQESSDRQKIAELCFNT